MITVWGRRSSVNVQKVLWTLAELEIPFTQEAVGGSFGGNHDADFLRMNPNGLVPVIRDGDVTMFESNAIVRYLSARYRGGLLRPTDHRGLAMAEQWMEWQQSTFAPAVSAIFFNNVRLPAAKRDAEPLPAVRNGPSRHSPLPMSIWRVTNGLPAANSALAISSWAACYGVILASIAPSPPCPMCWRGSKPSSRARPIASG